MILRSATADAAGALLDGRAIAGGAWRLAEPEPESEPGPESESEPELRTTSGSSTSDNAKLNHVYSGGGGSSNDVLLVDPPRAGLDAPTLRICRRFDHILYISCNPKALHQNLQGATCEQVKLLHHQD